MVFNAMDIQKGMEVYGSAGDKLGTVSEIYPYVGEAGAGAATDSPPSGATSSSTTALGTTSTMTPPARATGYFKVDQGGILGLGAKHLYIPYDAIDDVVLGECITVTCNKDDCDALFGTKPAFLEEQSS